MKDRGLKVRTLTWIFDPVTCHHRCYLSVTGWGATYNNGFALLASLAHVEATVYGARDGTLPGWACTSRDVHNIFKNSKLMKSGCVHDVAMLGRQDFFKPEATQQIRQMLLAFMTDIYIYIGNSTFMFFRKLVLLLPVCSFSQLMVHPRPVPGVVAQVCPIWGEQ